ncbi:CCA tRNA nucleotidyltransferase [Roseibium sp. MMSF_3412]|uniref:CCA tRNA nucleotidyltransferase n=1 Tax=Roseibium sp. MMSF_3412 TaxID=3046712 RepID=UPI00273EF650|nr:CCA tRNA nucleotidyltransferase [Roseibium sp. MMSF_3412]
MTLGVDEKLSKADWLSAPGIQAVFSAIERDGEEARVVGGAVRNTLLNHPVPDVDIATTASPETVMARAQDAGLKAIGTGIEHGTITVIADDFPYEVTTLREDIETFGRQARVVFGRDWEKDARRRDFTMNALYVDRNGHLHDPLGGLGDCLARRVRFIGDADGRIKEDYLRILRFFRIYAAYGEGELDPEGLGACLRQRNGLRQLSAERIGHEMRRLLRAPRAAYALRMMNDCGLWEIATGGLARIDDYEALRSLDELAPHTRDPELGLVVLAGFVREDLARVSDRLRLSNGERKRMETAWGARKRLLQADASPSAAAMAYAFGRQGAIDGLLAVWSAQIAGKADDSARFKEMLSAFGSQVIPEFPLKGADLISSGHKAGPELGALLKRLENEWIDSEFALTREHLLERSKTAS